MPAMWRLGLLLFLLPLAAAADSLTTARTFLELGLPRLALSRVERDQPANPKAPDWLEWESLRLTLLAQIQAPDRLLARVKALPAELPADFRQKVLGHAAWAHLERGEGAAARAELARLLWTFPLSSENHRWARRLVIRSWLADHRPEEAYRAMLRYQQDFAPLEREVATEFVRGLLAEGRAADALTWLNQLDSASAVAVWARLEAGLMAPEEAAARAGTELARVPQAADWVRVLAVAAAKMGDPLLALDALEREAAAGEKDRLAELWRSYGALGEATGNRAQLLQGEDEAWLALAAGLAATEPLRARAVYGTLAQKGSQAQTRQTARRRLFVLLAQGGRGELAARLLKASPWGEAPVSPEAGLRFAIEAAEALPPSARPAVLLAAARYGELEGRPELAADAAVQAVLATDLRNPDLAASETLKRALAYLERAGLGLEAAALHRYALAQRAPQPVGKTTRPARKRAP
jgi:hypothetical protein